MLLVSHELGAVADDLDHLIVLKRRVVFDGTPDELAATGVSLGIHHDDLPLWLEELQRERRVNVLPGMPWPLPWPFDRSTCSSRCVAGIVVGATAPLIGVFVVQKGHVARRRRPRPRRGRRHRRRAPLRHVAHVDRDGRSRSSPRS